MKLAAARRRRRRLVRALQASSASSAAPSSAWSARRGERRRVLRGVATRERTTRESRFSNRGFRRERDRAIVNVVMSYAYRDTRHHRLERSFTGTPPSRPGTKTTSLRLGDERALQLREHRRHVPDAHVLRGEVHEPSPGRDPIDVCVPVQPRHPRHARGHPQTLRGDRAAVRRERVPHVADPQVPGVARPRRSVGGPPRRRRGTTRPPRFCAPPSAVTKRADALFEAVVGGKARPGGKAPRRVRGPGALPASQRSRRRPRRRRPHAARGGPRPRDRT